MRLFYILTMLLYFNNNNPKYLHRAPLWDQHGCYLQMYIKIDHGRMYNVIEGKNYCCRQYFSIWENSKWKNNNKRMIWIIFTIIIKEDILCMYMQKKVSMFIKDWNDTYKILSLMYKLGSKVSGHFLYFYPWTHFSWNFYNDNVY